MEIEIKDFDGEGYNPLVSYHGWRVAIVNDCKRLREENIYKQERHLNTDEIFILLQGEAILHIGKDMEKYPMEIGKIYNVKKGSWHCITTKPGTKVVVVEDDDTDESNTEICYLRE